VHLKPLKKHLENVSNATFDEIEKHLGPMMHCVCLIWGNSKYYCSAPRIIVLLQEICNLLIEMARSHLGGSSILSMEPEEGLVKTTQVVNALQHFRDLYNAHKKELPVYFNQESDAKSWDFLPHLVFKRFDKFLNRMKTLLVIVP
jgi:dynein heavy chain